MPRGAIFSVALLAALGCSDAEQSGVGGSGVGGGGVGGGGVGGGGGGGESTVSIELPSLQSWSRVGDPVLRDPVAGENYEVASDAHAFAVDGGSWATVYTGAVSTGPGIRLAVGSAPDDWTVVGTLLEGVGPSGLDGNRETSFYRRANDGKHQIYYVAYDDEATYQSQIYLAESDALEGPYTVPAAPVIPRGQQDGLDVFLMTSPSVVEHEGTLFMVYIGWNATPEEVTEVWSLAAESNDDGRTWQAPRRVEVPITMEGQLTVGPDGRFYATSTGDAGGGEGIYLARADHPLGPYETLAEPVLTQAGAPWEVSEITAAQIYFENDTRTAYLNYTGADHALGWWVMLATTTY